MAEGRASDVRPGPVALRRRPGDAPRGFDSTRIWVFDLDNTLYPAECNLFAEVDHRMGDFIAKRRAATEKAAKALAG